MTLGNKPNFVQAAQQFISKHPFSRTPLIPHAGRASVDLSNAVFLPEEGKAARIVEPE